MKNLRNKNGITLVALVITIIILLILAVITINLTIGQRGILNRAQEAGRNYQEAAKREEEELANFLQEAEDIIKGIDEESKTLAKKVEIGDYVAYDPTEGVTDEAKLTYTSPVGTGMSHGNGYSDRPEGQTFTANSSIKWRVLSKDKTTGEVVLISDEPINVDAGQGLGMTGAIGYLYAEQELNEICKIYGYGKGANTSKAFSYETGDIVEGLTTGTIKGSGARSITIEDINKITKYNPENFTTVLNGTTYKYGDTYQHSIYYPTKTTETGKSMTAIQRSDKFTGYGYRGLEYLTNAENPMYKMLFGNGDLVYWVASRGVGSHSDYAYFFVFYVNGDGMGSDNLCIGGSTNMGEGSDAFSVRPIVYLKSNLKTSKKDVSGAWILEE